MRRSQNAYLAKTAKNNCHSRTKLLEDRVENLIQRHETEVGVRVCTEAVKRDFVQEVPEIQVNEPAKTMNTTAELIDDHEIRIGVVANELREDLFKV